MNSMIDIFGIPQTLNPQTIDFKLVIDKQGHFSLIKDNEIVFVYHGVSNKTYYQLETVFENVGIEKLEFYKYHLDSIRIALLNYNNVWYIAYPYGTERLDSNSSITSIIAPLIDTTNYDTNKIYYFWIRHPKFRKYGYDTKDSEITITQAEVYNKNSNKLIEHSQDDKLTFQTKKKFEEYFNVEDERITKLRYFEYGGFLVRVGLYYYFIPFRLFYEITELIPPNKNIHVAFLELYQSNQLKDIIPYLYKYPGDIIRRLTIVMKILTKEILNIYHNTRRKQNSEFYYTLPKIYKKILYDIHCIYVDLMNDNIKKWNLNEEYDFEIQRSINFDIVYRYLKTIEPYELINLMTARLYMLNKISKFEFRKPIFYTNNISMLIQTELMK